MKVLYLYMFTIINIVILYKCDYFFSKRYLNSAQFYRYANANV